MSVSNHNIFDENYSSNYSLNKLDMKKGILIICTVFTAVGFMAFSYMNSSNEAINKKETSCNSAIYENNYGDIFDYSNIPDLVYKVESRFNSTITKEDLNNAITILDIVPEAATAIRSDYRNVRVTILHDTGEITEIGENEVLNTAQIKLLKSADYSTNIRIESLCNRRNVSTCNSHKAINGQIIKNDQLVYYMTITPKKEAKYAKGYDALIDYLRENSKENTVVIRKDKLEPGRVQFTVTKTGKIKNVHLNSTCGYDSVDATLMNMISNMTGKWEPAISSKGKKVDQTFTFFFGIQGC